LFTGGGFSLTPSDAVIHIGSGRITFGIIDIIIGIITIIIFISSGRGNRGTTTLSQLSVFPFCLQFYFYISVQ